VKGLDVLLISEMIFPANHDAKLPAFSTNHLANSKQT